MKDETNPYDITEDLSFRDITTQEKLDALCEREQLIADTRAEILGD